MRYDGSHGQEPVERDRRVVGHAIVIEAVIEPAPSEPVVLATQPADKGIALTIHLPRSLAYFRGHFPSFAVLPGVVQVDWAMLLARRYLAVRRGAARAMRVKFARPIRPDAELTLTVDYDRAERLLHFEYRDRDYLYSSGRIELEDHDI